MLVISAHWEEREFTLQTHPQPPMLYDYYGFPQHTYDVKYPAPGSPEVAKRVQELLSKAGIKTNTDASRGFDVRSITYPERGEHLRPPLHQIRTCSEHGGAVCVRQSIDGISMM